MSVVHALADLQHWPGQSRIHFGVLEDTIENVFELQKVNSEPLTFYPFAQDCALLATQTVSPQQFLGKLLRRPFQGISNIHIENTNHVSCVAFSYLQNGHEVALNVHSRVHADIAIDAFAKSVLPLVDDIQNFRLHVGFTVECDVPTFLGTATAQRWNANKQAIPCPIVIDQGSLRGMPWLMSLTNSMSLQLWTAKKDSDESEPDSPTASEVDLVHDVLEGTSTDFSDVRHVLQCPEAVKKIVCE